MHPKLKVAMLLLELCVLPFLIFVSLLAKGYWLTPFLVAFFVGEVSSVYRRWRGAKKEKLQMESQRPASHYYYDRWYFPADSTRLNYIREKIQELRKKTARNKR
jgi:hypothetical protein